jgi:indole-3-glycerol phosphate synthase
MPEKYPAVAESGVSTAADAVRVVELGYRVALIGTTLMNTPEPRKLLSEILATARERAMSLSTRKLHVKRD